MNNSVMAGTGMNGFMGKNLSSKLNIIPIPHKQIDTIDLPIYNYFFFCSSYGNLASQKNEDMIFKANIKDLMTIMRKSKGISAKSFVYISSSSVLLPTQTTYSRCKRIAEKILLASDLPVLIIRPFTVCGLGDSSEHLIPTLLEVALSDKTINFVPDATHDFIDVEDLVDGIITLSEKGVRGIFELGTGISTSNQEVLELVEKVTGKKVNVNIVDSLRPYDTTNWVSTDFKAREFGWKPKKSLEESIKEQYEAIK